MSIERDELTTYRAGSAAARELMAFLGLRAEAQRRYDTGDRRASSSAGESAGTEAPV
jgi:hypothetical protein